jgi:ATP-binding cassette subfamily B protein
MLTKLRNAWARLPLLPRALALVWAAARGWTLGWAALLVIQGLLPVATVYLTRQVVDGLAAAVGSRGDWAQVSSTLAPVGLLLIVMLASRLFGSLSGWIRSAQSELVQDHISRLIHNQSIRLDLAFYESPEYHDRLHRARSEASFRPLSLLDNFGSLLQNGITLAAMAAVLLGFGLWLPLALVLSALPAFYVLLLYNRREREWVLRTTPDQRRIWYYDYMITAISVAAEMRLFGLGRYFADAYQKLRKRLRTERLAMARERILSGLAAGLLAMLIPGLALAYLVWQAVQGRFTLGDLALLYQAFNQGQGLMRSMLENLGQIYSSTLFLGDLFDFLALEPRVADPPQPRDAPVPLREGIRFRGVTFRYPGSERVALRDLDLFIPAGRIIAIVGANGAGKSTMIKLLCRLYDPDAGVIELDGVDLRALRVEEIRRLTTVLMQEPTRYSASVAENIALGDLSRPASRAEVQAAAQAADAESIIAGLPQGYDTPLGKWFQGGTDLSVGEWQRVALARAFWRRAPIMILDEPTSAMDSWAENEWMHRFAQLAAGRTVLLITHRFTTAMRADIIHVMEEGRIVESGSHAELVALGGRYAESWRAQMQEDCSNSPSG